MADRAETRSHDEAVRHTWWWFVVALMLSISLTPLAAASPAAGQQKWKFWQRSATVVPKSHGRST